MAPTSLAYLWYAKHSSHITQKSKQYVFQNIEDEMLDPKSMCFIYISGVRFGAKVNPKINK